MSRMCVGGQIEGRLSILVFFVVLCYWAFCLLDPVGAMYGLKFLAIGVVAVAVVTLLFGGVIAGTIYLEANYVYFLSLFCLFVPAYGLIVAVFRGGLSESLIDTSYISTVVYSLCSIIYVLRKDFMVASQAAAVLSMRLLACVVLSSFVFIQFGVFQSLFEQLLGWGGVYLGERVYAGYSFPYIYFIASPVLVFLVGYEMWRLLERFSVVRMLGVLLACAALFLSGTRANIIASVACPLLVVFWWLWGRAALVWGAVIFLFFFTILFFGYMDLFFAFFDPAEPSNAVKISYLNGYSQIFSDPLTLIFGQGFNAHAWSQVFRKMLPEGASKTELTYVEIFRVYGLFGGGIFLGSLAYLVMTSAWAKTEFGWVAPSLIIYLGLSFLNPYIFSSNGYLVLGFSIAAYAYVMRRSPRQQDRYQ